MSGTHVAGDQGDDLHGRTALLLLASPRADARALFLLSRSEAIVNTSPLPAARFLRVAVSSSAALPFADNVFDYVVVDGDQVPLRSAGRNRGPARNLEHEVARVLRHDGQCVLVARHNRVPVRRAEIGQYRAVAARQGLEAGADRGGIQCDQQCRRDHEREQNCGNRHDHPAAPPRRPAPDEPMCRRRCSRVPRSPGRCSIGC